MTLGSALTHSRGFVSHMYGAITLSHFQTLAEILQILARRDQDIETPGQ